VAGKRKFLLSLWCGHLFRAGGARSTGFSVKKCRQRAATMPFSAAPGPRPTRSTSGRIRELATRRGRDDKPLPTPQDRVETLDSLSRPGDPRVGRAIANLPTPDTGATVPASTADSAAGSLSRTSGLAGRLSLWGMILRTALGERLVYRGDFALGTLMRFLPIITQIFLWHAVFDSIGNAEGDDAATIGGFGFRDMVAYYLLTMIARAFSSMPGLASGIAGQIRDGEIKRYLIQPIDLIGFLLLTRIAHKLAYYAVAIAPFALVFFLCRSYFVSGFPSPHVFVAFIASLVMGFLIGFFLEAAIGMIGFWFLEVSSLLFVFMLFSYFLSGHMFPLSLLPDDIEPLVNFLPFKYLAYFPAAVFLGKIPADELPMEMAIEAAWLAFFIIVCRFAFNRGVRRYSGYGG
jgi:ABC-2 type transport system permease protein